MAYRSSTKGTGLSASASTVVPTGVAAGDIIILLISVDNEPTTFTWPSGFTQLDSQINTGDGQTDAIAWKRTTGADTGSYAVTISVSTDWALTALAWSGRDASNPPVNATAHVDNTTSSTISSNAVTALTGDDLAYLAGLDTSSSGTLTWTVPTGFTSEQNAVQGNFCNTQAATKDNVAAGSTSASGSVSGSQSHVGSVCWLVRIPASGGSPSPTPLACNPIMQAVNRASTY